MKLAKHTLLLDGNYFLYSRLHVLPRKKNEQLLKDEDGKRQLMRKLCIDLASEVRKLKPFVDQVVVAVDAKSWRKDLFPDAQYKGTREHDDSINWNNVFNTYVEWQQVIAKHGVTVHQINGAEADDVIFGWSTLLNNQGKNCIIWTGDKDLIQLVNYNNSTESYSLWYYNSQKKLVAFKGFEDLLSQRKSDNLSNDELLFNMASNEVLHDSMMDEMNNWIHNNRIKIQEVNCDQFIFSKILQGDSSDNIKSVVTWTKPTKTGKIRNYSISENLSLKILDQFTKEEGEFTIDMFFNKDKVEKISDIIYRVVGKATKNEIKTRFNQNLDLMLLHYNTIPEPIQNEIYNQVEKDINIKNANFGILSKMEYILEGTDWLLKKGTGAPSGFDPFAGLEDTTKDSKSEVKNNSLF